MKVGTGKWGREGTGTVRERDPTRYVIFVPDHDFPTRAVRKLQDIPRD